MRSDAGYVSLPIVVIISLSMFSAARGLLAIILLSMKHTMVVGVDSTNVDEQFFEGYVYRELESAFVSNDSR